MSLVTKIADLATRIGTEFKTVRTEISSAQTAAESYADSLAPNYDPAGSASTAQSSAQSYTDTVVGALTTTDIPEGTNKYYTDAKVKGVIGTAVQAGANVTVSYNAGTGITTIASTSDYTSSSFNTDFAAKDTDDLSEGTTNLYFTTARAQSALAGMYDPAGSAATAESNAQSYTDTAITNLVNGAPATLDTLNELAAALGSDANYSTTISTALGNRVRVDAAQTFTGTQKTQGRDNIGAAAASDLGDVASANFVTTFEGALV